MRKFLLSILSVIVSSLFLGTILVSCHEQKKFNAEQWDLGDGLTFNLRDGIVDDLLATQKFEGMKFRQVRYLLKHPQYMDTTKFYYEIIATRTNMNKPDHIKNLIFYISEDSTITKVELYDNKAPVKSRFF